MKTIFWIVLVAVNANDVSASEWEYLLDKNLSKWEVWMGIPHKSINGLQKGTYTSEYIWIGMGQPLGLNNDPKKVFTIKTYEDKQALYVTGEILGALTTLRHYENYHLSLKTKWGEKKWPPKLGMPRDTGLLFHCQGEHGNSKPLAWKACLEFQIMESGFGDFIALGGTFGNVKGIAVTKSNGDVSARYNPLSTTNVKHLPFARAHSNQEKPHGEWNQVDLYTLEGNAIYVVNGVIVNVIENTVDKYKRPLTKGQIQLQSEGAEVYYTDIKIRLIEKIPKTIHKQLSHRKVPLELPL